MLIRNDVLFRLDVDFICRRGTLKTLFSTPYRKSDGWIICASKYRGTIYLCEYYTPQKEYEAATETITEKQNASQGSKFEQYMVAGSIIYFN